jgi:excisionase family DNA binding protein
VSQGNAIITYIHNTGSEENMNGNTVDRSDAMNYDSSDITGLEDVKVSVETKLEKLLTVQEISELLKVPRSYVYGLTHQKRIPHLKIQGLLRFRQSHIEEWLNSQEVSDVSI